MICLLVPSDNTIYILWKSVIYMQILVVWETIGPFGTNGCRVGVRIWDGTFSLFNQSQASMEGPIPNLDSIFEFDPTYPSQNMSLFADGT